MKKSDVAKAINTYKGNISAIARAFNRDRKTVYEYIRKNDLWDKVEEARETMVDNVESALYQQALSGNTTAMIFFLKTQGKDRGYVERVEQQNSGETTIRVVRDDGRDND